MCLHGDGNGWAVKRLDAVCIDVGQPVPPSAVKRRRVENTVGGAGTRAALDGRRLEVDQLGLCEVVYGCAVEVKAIIVDFLHGGPVQHNSLSIPASQEVEQFYR